MYVYAGNSCVRDRLVPWNFPYPVPNSGSRGATGSVTLQAKNKKIYSAVTVDHVRKTKNRFAVFRATCMKSQSQFSVVVEQSM
jgi:hypothetical protein